MWMGGQSLNILAVQRSWPADGSDPAHPADNPPPPRHGAGSSARDAAGAGSGSSAAGAGAGSSARNDAGAGAGSSAAGAGSSAAGAGSSAQPVADDALQIPPAVTSHRLQRLTAIAKHPGFNIIFKSFGFSYLPGCLEVP